MRLSSPLGRHAGFVRMRTVLPTLLVGMLLWPVTAAAQSDGAVAGEAVRSEVEVLDRAQEAEARGDVAAAEAMLRALLERRRGSLSAVLSLERLLRMQGRIEEIVPLVERLLDHDPDSPIGHQLALRTLSALDRPSELERAQDRWIEVTPELATPYREAARVWMEREEPERAVEVLERGRQRLGSDELALELGAAYAHSGDDARAVDEWQRAIGADARSFRLVQRRLLSLPDGGARLTPRMIMALRSDPSTAPRLRAALSLAVDAGLEDEALELAGQVLPMLDAGERQEFLLHTGREADAAREPRLAYWAYTTLLEGERPETVDEGALQRRVAELAVAVGDTAAARRAYSELAEQTDPGSVALRQAEASSLELELPRVALDDAQRMYEAFRADHPDAPELDRLAAVLAVRALGQGRDELAGSVIRDVRGPETARVRARLALRKGEPEAARTALLAAAAGLRGTDATDAIGLATLLGRATPEGARRLGAALLALDAGEVEAAIDTIVRPSLELRPDERAALLDFAARLAEREAMPLRAEAIRRTLIEEHPAAYEAPAALLGLARALAQRPGDQAEASTLVERLILEHPRSALVPQARRLRAELDEQVPRS